MDIEGFSQSVRANALLVIARGEYVEDALSDGLWWIDSLTKDRSYRVELFDGGVTCNCPNGTHQARAQCYHACAAATLEKLGERSRPVINVNQFGNMLAMELYEKEEPEHSWPALSASEQRDRIERCKRAVESTTHYSDFDSVFE